MKTLIISGSPKSNGNTMYLVKELEKFLKGKVEIIESYKEDIKGCVDCKYCYTHNHCAFSDFKNLSLKLKECDNIVMASPIYFSEVTGNLLNVLSKCQIFWANKYLRSDAMKLKNKKGGIILTHAGHCVEDKPEKTLKAIMNCLKVKSYYPRVVSGDTDNIPTRDDKKVIEDIKGLADFLNDGFNEKI